VNAICLACAREKKDGIRWFSIMNKHGHHTLSMPLLACTQKQLSSQFFFLRTCTRNTLLPRPGRVWGGGRVRRGRRWPGVRSTTAARSGPAKCVCVCVCVLCVCVAMRVCSSGVVCVSEVRDKNNGKF
jgi:hypothetical protein